MFATFVNMVAVIAGTIVGMFAKGGIPKKIEDTIMSGMGLAIILIGLQMAIKADNMIIVTISLAVGGLIGELCKLDDRLNGFGEWLKAKTKIEDNYFVDGFVNASLIFCVGAMAILGSIAAGLEHDYTIIFTKSTLDGIMAIVLASSMGIGVAFSAIAILIYQGAITLMAGMLQGILTETVVAYLSATGGLLIMGIGLNVAEIKRINVVNLLPGIFIAAAVAGFLG